MGDVMTPEQRSRTMSHIKGKDTSIEVILRKALWHKGIRYRKNYKKLPGTPDIAITKYSLITVLLNSYLDGGFLSMVEFYVRRADSPKTKDEAMRQVADLVYNVFKYHLVKYLGLFDVFFRYQVSKSENVNMEDVAGLGVLLQKLEYNALSPNARKVSDYGVPLKLIDCYDSETPYDKGQFDAYEQYVDQEISRLFEE